MMKKHISHLITVLKNRGKKGITLLLLYLFLKWTLILTLGKQLLKQPWWKAQYALFLPLVLVCLLLIKHFYLRSKGQQKTAPEWIRRRF